MLRKLRPYQLDALAGIRSMLDKYASCVCVLPTGTGKTSVAATLMNEWQGGNCLFLAHTRELVDQAADRLAGELGYRPVIEMGLRGGQVDLMWDGGMVVVGSVQSMLTDRRLAKYESKPFDLIVIDECVTGDTVIETDVGKIRIDSLPTSPARSVMTYNGSSVCYRPITAFMPKGMRPVLRIETASGKVIRCTGNHPLYTRRGWVNASDVRESDSLLSVVAGVENRPESTSGGGHGVTPPVTNRTGSNADRVPNGSDCIPSSHPPRHSASVGVASKLGCGLELSNHSSASTRGAGLIIGSSKGTTFAPKIGPSHSPKTNDKPYSEPCSVTVASATRTAPAVTRESPATTEAFSGNGSSTKRLTYHVSNPSSAMPRARATGKSPGELLSASPQPACPVSTASPILSNGTVASELPANGSTGSETSALHGGCATTALPLGTGSPSTPRDSQNQTCDLRRNGSARNSGRQASTATEVSISFSGQSALPDAPSSRLSSSTSRSVCSTNFDPVVSLSEDGTEPVYDISVEGTHCFFGNGVLVHNCHRATSRSYRKIVDFFTSKNKTCKVVGLTATPNRADGTALGLVFEQVGYAMDIPDAIDGGWLVPVRQRAVVVSQVEITGPSKTNEIGEKDFTDAAVESVMIDESALVATADPLVREANGRPTIVFCATVRHAHELAAVIDRYAPGSALAVDGETPKEQRDEAIARFKRGEVQFLCNAQLFVEGFDAPTCSCVAVARPTKSTGRYTQMVGRGLRPLAGVVDFDGDAQDRKLAILTSEKSDCLVLDFVNAGAAGLVTVDDILGGDYDAEVREAALVDRKAGDTSVSESLKRAKFLLSLEREMEARAGNRAAVAYETFDRDGRPVASANGKPQKRGTITDGQLGLLVALGMEPAKAAALSSHNAKGVITAMKETHCTDKQRKVIARAGIDPKGIGMERAGRIITALKENNWQRPEVIPE